MIAGTMNRSRRLVAESLGALSIFLLIHPASADTILVPREVPTIQGAIEVSVDGDEIVVAPGTYNERISFLGKAVTLHSSDGPAVTIIDASNLNDHVVMCTTGEGRDTVLQGFTITGGLAPRGGGMFNVESHPTVTNCIFVENAAESPPFVEAEGGGMYNYRSNPAVTNCVFRRNRVWAAAFAVSQGGGMYNEESSPIIRDCIFEENTVELSLDTFTQGAGMYNLFSSPQVSNCHFIGNYTGGSFLGNEGAGMYNETSSPTVTDCTFVENWDLWGHVYGAGMNNAYEAHPTVVRCTFMRNDTFASGAGMENFSESHPLVSECTFLDNRAGGGAAMNNNAFCSPTLSNCVFRGNRAVGQGGGVRNSASNPQLIDCVFQENSVSGSGLWQGGGGVWNDQLSAPTIINCIFLGNMAARGAAIHNFTGGSPSIVNCDFRQNYSTAAGGVMYSTNPDNDNYSSSPQIVNSILWDNGPLPVIDGNQATTTIAYSDVEHGWFGRGVGNINEDPLWALRDDAHLLAGSPCIDAGTNDPEALPPNDADGNPRSLDGDGDGNVTTDMGIYEYNTESPTIAVSQPELFVPEGHLNQAGNLLLIRNGGGGLLEWKISSPCPWLVAEPSAGETDGEIDEISLQIADLPHGEYACDLAITAAGAVNSPRMVTLRVHVTVTLRVPGDYPTIQSAIDESLDGDTVLVADGVHNGLGNKNLDFGGRGITVRSQGDDPRNCIIDCERQGLGVDFNSGESPAAVFRGFTIRNALAPAAVNIENGSRPTILNCIIRDSTPDDVGSFGGGVLCFDSSPTIERCLIIGNAKGQFEGGGGIYVSGSSLTIVDSAIIGNYAGGPGGGIYAPWGSVLRLVRSTITGNTSGSGAGGIYLRNHSSASMDMCHIGGNRSSSTTVPGGAITCARDGSATVSNSILVGNTVAGDGGAVGCSAGSVTMTNCTVAGNTAQQRGGAVWCESEGEIIGDVIVVNSILWGDLASEGWEIGIESAFLAADYCDIQGGEADVLILEDAVLSWGEGNIAAQPQFRDLTVGTWSADGMYEPSAHTVTFTDTDGNWGSRGLVGLWLSPDTSQGLQFPIVANTQTTITTLADSETIDAGTSQITRGLAYTINDYHVDTESPCIDVGSSIPEQGERDLDGHARMLCAAVDMGAYEFGIGDFDCSRIVDLFDFSEWTGCETGPEARGYAPGCEAFDFDFDGKVDFEDYRGFQVVFEGDADK